jgi:Holliday junction resolvase RusA-like endonuclease
MTAAEIIQFDPTADDIPVFSVFVPGNPAAQSGSIPINRETKAGRKFTVVLSKGSKGFTGWRKVMNDRFILEARQRGLNAPLDGPLSTSIVFYMPRLSDAVMKGRTWPHTSLDADKLERAVNDSLQTAKVITNDSRICKTHRLKRYATTTETPGVLVRIWQLDTPARQR